MKIIANYHKKQPVAGVEYASEGYHLTIEIEPPAEVQEDRDKLRSYVERLFSECRARVEAEFGQHGRPDRSETTERQVDERRASRRAVGTHRTRSTFRHHGGNGRNHNGRNGRNGHDRDGTTNAASTRQLNYLRSLAGSNGIGYDGLAELAQEAFGKPVLKLSKREASQLIDELRPEDRE